VSLTLEAQKIFNFLTLHYSIFFYCRRFRDFSELNSQVKQNFKGHHLRTSLPPLPEKHSKLTTNHNSQSFLDDRYAKLEVNNCVVLFCFVVLFLFCDRITLRLYCFYINFVYCINLFLNYHFSLEASTDETHSFSTIPYFRLTMPHSL
jgi:PX domain